MNAFAGLVLMILIIAAGLALAIVITAFGLSFEIKKIAKQNKLIAQALNKLQPDVNYHINIGDTKIWPKEEEVKK